MRQASSLQAAPQKGRQACRCAAGLHTGKQTGTSELQLPPPANPTTPPRTPKPTLSLPAAQTWRSASWEAAAPAVPAALAAGPPAVW